jgi:MerR family regulatory protein
MVSNVQASGGVKKYYTIGEVAQLFNTSTSLIRFWEKNSLLYSLTKTNKASEDIRKQTLLS